jgi:hypothetical protein
MFAELITHLVRVEYERANSSGFFFKLADLWTKYEKRLHKFSPNSIERQTTVRYFCHFIKGARYKILPTKQGGK